MNRRGRRNRIVLLTLSLLAGLVGACMLWIRAERRQHVLNRHLIAALVKGDDKQALALVNEGADPNTRYKTPPVPSLFELVKQLFRRSPTSKNDSPTALSIACGAPWDDVDMTLWAQSIHPDAAQLVKAMLRQGATVNARNENKMTPLMWAAQFNRPDTVMVLLEHGADVNAQDSSGTTALNWAVSYDIVSRSISSVASVNEPPGNVHATASVRATLGKLLAYGADPNLADKAGRTPLSLAKDIESPDIIALLKQPGAK